MRGLRGPDDRRVAILLYHRLDERGGDPLGLNVSPDRLEQQLRALSNQLDIVPLAEVSNRSRTNRGRAVAITFDDGYAGLLDEAKSRLERAGIPATAFIPSGFVGSGREFWWEELEGILLHEGALPPSLELTIEGRTVRWTASGRRNLRGTQVSARGRLYYLLARLLARVRDPERKRVLAELSAWAGVNPPHRRARMPLGADELQALATGGTLEIGAHTVSHPVLASLAQAEQEHEIAGSKTALEAIIGSPVKSFAYPYGGSTDYTDASVFAVRAAGFERACANMQGPVGPQSDRFQLPRFIVRDWDADTLLRRLDRLFARWPLAPVRSWRRRAA